MKFLIWGAMPLGSVLGGLRATATGLRTTLWAAAIGTLLAALWLLLSPLRTMRDLLAPSTPDLLIPRSVHDGPDWMRHRVMRTSHSRWPAPVVALRRGQVQ